MLSNFVLYGIVVTDSTNSVKLWGLCGQSERGASVFLSIFREKVFLERLIAVLNNIYIIVINSFVRHWSTGMASDIPHGKEKALWKEELRSVVIHDRMKIILDFVL